MAKYRTDCTDCARQTSLMAEYRTYCTDYDRPDCTDGRNIGQTVQIWKNDKIVLMAKYRPDCTDCDRRPDCTDGQMKARLYRL